MWIIHNKSTFINVTKQFFCIKAWTGKTNDSRVLCWKSGAFCSYPPWHGCTLSSGSRPRPVLPWKLLAWTDRYEMGTLGTARVFIYSKRLNLSLSPIRTRVLWALPPPSLIWQVYVPSFSVVKWSMMNSITPVEMLWPILFGCKTWTKLHNSHKMWVKYFH